MPVYTFSGCVVVVLLLAVALYRSVSRAPGSQSKEKAQ